MSDIIDDEVALDSQMSNMIIDDVFALKRPILIEIKGTRHYYDIRLKDEDNKEQLIKFNDVDIEGKCVLKRINPKNNNEVLYSEVYSESLFPSITSFLFDVTSKFDEPPPDAKFRVDVQVLSPLFYIVPYIQRINYYVFIINYDRSFLDLLNQMDTSKMFSIKFSSNPLSGRQALYFFKTRAFKRLKNIKMLHDSIDCVDFLEFDAENMTFLAHIDSNEAINLKIKKWLSDIELEYKSITINKLEIKWDVILHGISVIDNNGTTDTISRKVHQRRTNARYSAQKREGQRNVCTVRKYVNEYIIQRSDGTVARLSYKNQKFQFINEGKKELVIAKDEVSKEDLHVPIDIFEKIATYFDIKTQRRFAQTCKGAGEIVRRSNRVWPKVIDYYHNRNMACFAIHYTTSIVDQLFFTILQNEECFISREGFKIDPAIQSTPEMEVKANDVAVKCLSEKLEYLKNDCPHEIKMRLSGQNWPIQLLDLNFFNASPRYVLRPTLPFTDQFIAFLKHLDTKKEVILGKFNQFEEVTYDRQFFSSDVVRKFKYLEMNADCEITGRQFIDLEAEVFQIQVETMTELAVNGKIMKWMEKKQNIKYFGIILKSDRDDYSIEEVLDGIEYMETDHKDKFKESYKGFKIRRDDGIEAELFISQKRIVFSTCQLPSYPWSYQYEMSVILTPHAEFYRFNPYKKYF